MEPVILEEEEEREEEREKREGRERERERERERVHYQSSKSVNNSYNNNTKPPKCYNIRLTSTSKLDTPQK